MGLTPLLAPSVSHGAQGHYARKLLNDLMKNYSNALRPVEDTDEALNVSLQITLSQIKDMVSRNLNDLLWNRQHDRQMIPVFITSRRLSSVVVVHYVSLPTAAFTSRRLKREAECGMAAETVCNQG